MSERKKPSEALALVSSQEAGEVLEVIPELLPVEKILKKWKEHTYKGAEILEIPPRRWLVPGWLTLDSLLAVYAGPGVGKSFYALSMALEIARGGSWLGTPLEASPVLYVAGERATELRDRAEAWCAYHSRMIPENFEILDSPHPPQLTAQSNIEALCEKIKECGAKFVVLDTYARMTLGIDESSSRDAGPILQALDEIRRATNGGTVLVIHHTGKDVTKGLRGSSAFLGAVDIGITLTGDGTALKASVDKSNAGAIPIPEWYKLETVQLETLQQNEPRSSAVLTHTGAPIKDSNLEQAVIDILTATTSGSLSKNELIEALAEQGRKVSSSGLDRLALRSLMDRGLVAMNGGGRLTRYSVIEPH
jgi:hypothetical protein